MSKTLVRVESIYKRTTLARQFEAIGLYFWTPSIKTSLVKLDFVFLRKKSHLLAKRCGNVRL
jgi:hypothetical protein